MVGQVLYFVCPGCLSVCFSDNVPIVFFRQESLWWESGTGV